jgi:phenylpyruvate tautomerase PptA (4-oxalocrotonate tautomerase family)
MVSRVIELTEVRCAVPFVEVFAPKGSLRDEQRAEISHRMVREVMRAEGAPDTAEARAISWLVWHDAEAWSVGGVAVESGEPPRYVVRVAVPAGSMSDDKRSDIIRRVTQVLADADDDPPRLWSDPLAWVHVTEIPEGNWGALGRVVRFEDIASYVQTGTANGPRPEATAPSTAVGTG